MNVANRWFMHRVVHIMLTLIMLWLAIEYGLDSQDNLLKKSYTVYTIMSETFTVRQWAAFCFVGSMVGMSTVFADNWRTRTIGSGILCGCHLVIAAFMFLGNPYATITGFFIANALLGLALSYSTAYLGQRLSGRVASSDTA